MILQSRLLLAILSNKDYNFFCLNSEETTQLRRMATWKKGPTTEPRTRDLRPNAEFRFSHASHGAGHAPSSHIATYVPVVSSEFKQLIPAHKEHIQRLQLLCMHSSTLSGTLNSQLCRRYSVPYQYTEGCVCHVRSTACSSPALGRVQRLLACTCPVRAG